MDKEDVSKQITEAVVEPVIEPVVESDSEKDIKHIIYLAYLVCRLTDFKYRIYALRDLGWDIKRESPAGYDDGSLLMKTLRRWKPELIGEKKTVREIEKNVEKYLFKTCVRGMYGWEEKDISEVVH